MREVLIIAALALCGLVILAMCQRLWRWVGDPDGDDGARKRRARWFYPIALVCLAAWMATAYVRFA